MIIKSNASPDELSSPFLKKNQQFCFDFETFIISKHGKVKGSYNAWSYLIHGKIQKPKNWVFEYKKSTYSGVPTLWISSKKMNLLTLAKWSTNIAGSDNLQFVIKKKSFLSVCKSFLTQKTSIFQPYKSYVIESSNKNLKLVQDLKIVLDKLFKNKEIYRIKLNNNKLTIELRSDKHHFDVLEDTIKKIM